MDPQGASHWELPSDKSGRASPLPVAALKDPDGGDWKGPFPQDLKRRKAGEELFTDRLTKEGREGFSELGFSSRMKQPYYRISGEDTVKYVNTTKLDDPNRDGFLEYLKPIPKDKEGEFRELGRKVFCPIKSADDKEYGGKQCGYSLSKNLPFVVKDDGDNWWAEYDGKSDIAILRPASASTSASPASTPKAAALEDLRKGHSADSPVGGPLGTAAPALAQKAAAPAPKKGGSRKNRSGQIRSLKNRTRGKSKKSKSMKNH